MGLTFTRGGGSRPPFRTSLHDGERPGGVLPLAIVARRYLPLLGRGEWEACVCGRLLVELALEKFLPCW